MFGDVHDAKIVPSHHWKIHLTTYFDDPWPLRISLTLPFFGMHLTLFKHYSQCLDCLSPQVRFLTRKWKK